MRAVIGVAALVLAGGAVFWFVQGSASAPESAFLAACEAEIKTRLKAPSTYQRTEVASVSSNRARPEQAIPLDEAEKDSPRYIKARDTLIELYDKRGVFRHSATIIYDAANTYGTPVQGIAKCSLFTSSEDMPRADDISSQDIRIDGKTTTEWLMDDLRSFAQ